MAFFSIGMSTFGLTLLAQFTQMPSHYSLFSSQALVYDWAKKTYRARLARHTNSLKQQYLNTRENWNGCSEAAFAKMRTPYLGHEQLKARFSSWERSGIFALTLCLAPYLGLKIHTQARICPKPVVTLGPWKHKTCQKKPVSQRRIIIREGEPHDGGERKWM